MRSGFESVVLEFVKIADRSGQFRVPGSRRLAQLNTACYNACVIMRFVSGIIGIPLLIVLLLIGEGWPFVLGVWLLAVLGLNEFYRGVRKVEARPQEWLGFACTLLFMFAARERFHPPFVSMPAALTVLVLASLTIELLRPNRAPIRNLGATYLGVIYSGWLFSYLVALRSISGDTYVPLVHRTIPRGAWLVLYVVFAAWAADTGAYLVGRKWGRRKLAPVLSPGKTWEGTVAGILWSLAMSVLMGRLAAVEWVHVIVLGVGIALVSLVGDLAESSMKRDIGIKDFGTLLPGHGGILDRFDGLLFAAPLFYYYVVMVMGY